MPQRSVAVGNLKSGLETVKQRISHHSGADSSKQFQGHPNRTTVVWSTCFWVVPAQAYTHIWPDMNPESSIRKKGTTLWPRNFSAGVILFFCLAFGRLLITCSVRAGGHQHVYHVSPGCRYHCYDTKRGFMLMTTICMPVTATCYTSSCCCHG